MAPQNDPDYHAFHGRESFANTPRPIGAVESVGNFVKSLWRHRSALRAGGPVQTAKDIIPELPLNDPIGKFLSNEVMHLLWGSMLHPPSSYKGNKYQYRAANGKNNSMLYPDLGMAGLPYAKSVQAQSAVNGAKPDVGDLFDLLMARDEESRESDTGISSMLLYQATIVIHDVFRTNDDDKNLSDTSSYLDLSPLYGKDQAAQDSIRLHKDGQLKPDSFAEHRLLNQPPGVSIFLVMYNRFHNYVAKQLLEINENGKFDRPLDYHRRDKQQKEAADRKRDEDLFQTARLITCGLYAQVAIHDYLRCLMMMHAKDTSWTLDPRKEYNRFFDKGTVPRGQGNMVSVEFNLLYRFHSALSKKDEEWAIDLFEMWMAGAEDENGPITRDRIANGEVPISVMGQRIGKENKRFRDSEAPQRKSLRFFPEGFDRVGGARNGNKVEFVFKRNDEGYFDDAQMVGELVRSMEDPMYSFGARQIPKVFKSIEMLGILQSRKWEVCSLNEFRQFFGMKPFKRFEDVNSDPKICNALRDLYGDVDSVELYPGYLCEGQGRNLDPNVSCPDNQATALWRGIFSDAVTLVRSDRFYTTEWNVNSITAWGMQEVSSDPTINKGGLLYKLCHRAFPGYFKYNSLHLWQPYYTPAKNLLLASAQGKLKDLDLDGLEYSFEARDAKDDYVGATKWIELKTDREGHLNGELLARLEKQSDNGQRLRVRRKLIADGNTKPYWRGREMATKVAQTGTVIDDYSAIKKMILGGKNEIDWVNPAVLAKSDIPKGPLREIMTNKYDARRWNLAIKTMRNCLGTNDGKLNTSQFLPYFESVAEEIRIREQRSLQKMNGEQVYQLDVVADYAIPVITKFIADFLGFWDRVKTPSHPDREFSENAIYELLDNCQDFQSWDADQTKGMKRRQLFQVSIQKLKSLADHGVQKSSAGLFGWRNLFRSYGTDSREVTALRKLAVTSIQALLYQGFNDDEVASIMLQFALDSAHKLVLNFTEILAYFVDPKTHSSETIGDHTKDSRTNLWRQIQELALEKPPDANKLVSKYALEAQRLSPSLKLARQYVGEQDATISYSKRDAKGVETKVSHSIRKGQTVLLDIHAANRNPDIFPSPEKFSLDRDANSYLIFGTSVDQDGKAQPPPFAKQLGLVCLTALLKYASTMKQVRVAHDKSGRLKRVETPYGLPGYPAADSLSRYMSPQWDVLLPFPVTWELRYNGIGRGVWEGGDNANQGHGQNQVYQTGKPSGAYIETAPPAPTVVMMKENVLSKDRVNSKALDRAVSVTTAEVHANAV